MMQHNARSMVIENASVVMPDRVITGASIKVVDGIIAYVSTSHLNGCDKRIDAGGMFVLPGFVDLHSDAIEKEIEPRPSANFPINMALFELDKKLGACGITTMYHSISFSDNEIGIRNNMVASRIVEEANRLAPRLGVRTKIHARFEITSMTSIPQIERLLSDGSIHLFSIMDHTPGQGQFRDLSSYIKYFTGRNDFADDSFARKIAEEKLKSAVSLKADHVMRLVDQCRALGIPVASHDDDTKEKLDSIESMGIGITEFPVNMETVISAADRGIHICYGSPNVVRGSSTSGNLSARDAIMSGFGDILCSDYAPMSLIHAVFTLERSGMPLHQAANMASLHPARAAGIDSYTGSIQPGKSADMVIVDPADEVPRVMKTIVGGREAYSTW